MPAAINNGIHSGIVTSPTFISTLKQMDEVDGLVTVFLDIPEPTPTCTFMMRLESTDGNGASGPWYTLVRGDDIPAIGTQRRDGKAYEPTMTYASTVITAKHMRVVVGSSEAIEYAAWVEVD